MGFPKMNLNELESLTGKTFRTLKKRLEALEPCEVTTKGNFYDTRLALPLIFENQKPEGELDLSIERAKLAKCSDRENED